LAQLLEPSLNTEQAILTEPLANIVHLFRIALPAPFFRLAIVGAGTMGTLALLIARSIGAKDIVVADINDQRLAIMEKLGASGTVSAARADALEKAREITLNGFDVVIDASGTAAARQLAFDLCRAGGQVVLLGMATQRSEVNFV
jgi:threonine 3-dehydrogenase